jgi:hypothetical protein
MAHASPLTQLLTVPLIDRTRRNHGLEHATITLLSQRQRGLSMVGRSTPNGFYLYGDITTEALTEAVHQALQRMKGGERDLAVHPNCGTNFVTAGCVAALAGFFGFLGANTWRARLERLPTVMVLMTVALIFAQPLGLAVQRDITTSGDMREMEIVGIERRPQGGVMMHFVATRN